MRRYPDGKRASGQPAAAASAVWEALEGLVALSAVLASASERLAALAAVKAAMLAVGAGGAATAAATWTRGSESMDIECSRWSSARLLTRPSPLGSARCRGGQDLPRT